MEWLLAAWLIFAILLSGFYVLLLHKFTAGWRALPSWKIPAGYSPETTISIIIPARNEARHLPALIRSLMNLNYPVHLFEVIFVDDFSTDDTASIIRDSAFELIRLSDFFDESNITSHKKKGIQLAIEKAKGQLIVTTDADCVVPENWLQYFASYYEHTGAKVMAAPVIFYDNGGLLEKFQALDFIGTMGVTGAGIYKRLMYSANGANLAYEKSVFKEVGGFAGNEEMASGDDVFLVQKIAGKYPGKVGFIKNKEATVHTQPQRTVRDFLSQRLRWATKSTAYQQKNVTLIWIGVFLLCTSIGLSFLLLPFSQKEIFLIFAIPFLTKLTMDFIFLKMMTGFFNEKILMKYFFPSALMHIVYVGVIGLAANFIKEYRWKGRRTK